MHRTRARLPDGREIVYYDEAPGRRPVPDPSYDVAVFENRFPSFDMRAPFVDGVERSRGTGRCEVVCFTDDHSASMATLPLSRVRTVVDAWRPGCGTRANGASSANRGRCRTFRTGTV